MSTAYLDHAATTPIRAEVIAAMEPYLWHRFGNPSSSHQWGQDTSVALENARAKLASAIGANPSEIIFVRGGTESDNMGVIGGTRSLAHTFPDSKPLILVSEIEHSAVIEPAQWLENRGEAELRTIPITPEGTIGRDLSSVNPSKPPCLVSFMWANNETGLLLPLSEVCEWGKPSNVVVHTDASQAVGKVPVNVSELGVDLLTATGHKLGGPRGCGVLYIRNGIQVEPLIFGGGQERSLRPGTEDVAGAVGLAEAVHLAVSDLDSASAHMEMMRDRLQARLLSNIPGLRINCGTAPRVPHVLSVGIPDIEDAGVFLTALDLEGIAASGGSACHSGAHKSSHVISALYGPEDSLSTIRLSVGRDTTEDEVDSGAKAVTAVWSRLSGLTAG
ncbi:MAG: cysteine desulfurase family protein [Gemmatimonadota bacterium]|mgnify:FL=1|nr:cysteine desulfurase family protein [Gemmatimonadota bacterium]